MPNQPKIPIVLVTGFLGAGKTTFLRQLLPMFDGLRKPYVILNDFLNAEIDTAMLRQVSQEIFPISAGCVCCDANVSLNEALEKIPDEPPYFVLIEANGTTDPYPLIELIMLLPQHHRRFGPVLQLNIINEKRWQKRLAPWDRALERAQAMTASHLFTNRRLEASLRQQLQVRSDLATYNPQAMRIDSIEQFATILNSLDGATQPVLNMEAPLPHGHPHIATRIEMPPLPEEILIRWLKSFPPDVLRIKGATLLLDSDDEACFFQRTDDDLERPMILKGKMPETTQPCAVFIGHQLDADAIATSLKAMLDQKPNLTANKKLLERLPKI